MLMQSYKYVSLPLNFYENLKIISFNLYTVCYLKGTSVSINQAMITILGLIVRYSDSFKYWLMYCDLNTRLNICNWVYILDLNTTLLFIKIY